MKKLIQMDFNNDLMQVGVFSEEEAELLSGTVSSHTTQIQNLINSANTINDNLVIIENEIDGLGDGLSALSAEVQEIIEEDYVTEEELDERGYLTESAASETYQPITQFRTINSSAITGDNSNLEVYYDDTQVKADILKLSGDIQTIVGGDFVTQDDLSAYTTIQYAENTYLKEVPSAITNDIQVISAQVQTISGSYLTQDDLDGYATTAFTEATYLKEVPSGITNNIQIISGQVQNISGAVQTISGSYLTQEDLDGYATTAFTEATYLKEVPSGITRDIQIISGQVETLGNTVVNNSQNIQTISGNVNTISGDVETLKNTHFVQEGDNVSVLINDAGYLLPSSLKTINKMSLIGNGDITIGTGETYDDTEIQHRVDVVSGDVQTISGNVNTISGQVQTISGNVNTISGQVIALSGSLDDYLTEAEAAQTYQLKTQFRTINGNAITGDNTNIVIEGGSEYSAGTNIDITNDVISVTGISVPTNLSDLVNDAGYLTKSSADTIYAKIGDIPTSTSALTNDSGYLTSSDLKTINSASIVGSGNIVVPTIWIGTQAQYDALPSYSENTIYCIEKTD